MSGRPAENWPNPSLEPHGAACGCGRCASRLGAIDRLAGESLRAALAHAQQGRFEADMGSEAGRLRQVTLPGQFSGWRDPVPLIDVLGSNPPADFNRTQGRFLYRIAKRVGGSTPLYIGMAFSTKVRDRVVSHLMGVIKPAGRPADRQQPRRGYSEIANLREEIRRERKTDPDLRNITVQLGTIDVPRGIPLDAKLLHAYEAALQVIERPRAYVGSAWTFEEEGL